MLVFTLISIYAIRHSSKNAFLLDKRLSGFAAGMSAVATLSSGFIFVAAIGMGYSMGLSALILPLSALLGHLIFWPFFAKKVVSRSHSTDCLSVIEMIKASVTEKTKYDSIFFKLFSFFVSISLLAFLMAQFVSIEKVMTAFTNLEPIVPMMIILLFIVIYSSIGGFIASVYTDILQGIVMFLLAIGSITWALFKAKNGFADIAISNPELILWHGKMPEIKALFLGISFFVIGFTVNIAQPHLTIRIMAIKDKKQLNIARVIFIVLTQLNWAGMIFLGFCLRVISSGVKDPEMALSFVAKEYMSPLFTMFIMVGILCAVISTIDSLLVAISSGISYDILGYGRQNKRKTGLFINKSVIILVGILSIVLSSLFPASVFELSMICIHLLTSSVAVAVSIMIFYNKIDSRYLIASVLIGVISALLWKCFGFIPGIAEGVVGYCSGLVIYVVCSKILKK